MGYPAKSTKKSGKSRGSESLKQKIIDRRNIIRNKFKKACEIRRECEHDVDQAMKPIGGRKKSMMNDFSPQEISAKKCKHQQCQSSVEKNVNPTSKFKLREVASDDPNILCNKLRVLLSSTKATDTKRREEISNIINHLHTLDVFV